MRDLFAGGGDAVEELLAGRLQLRLRLGRPGGLLEAVALRLERRLRGGLRHRIHLADARLVLRDVVVALLNAGARARAAALVVRGAAAAAARALVTRERRETDREHCDDSDETRHGFLPTFGKGQGYSTHALGETLLIACSAIAVIVRLGFTPR